MLYACSVAIRAAALRPAARNNVEPAHVAVVWSVLLFVGMLLALEAGYRVGRREQTDKGHPGTGAVEAALFGLLGLILAFTFSGAASRLDARRTMIVDEANAIG